MSDKNNKDTELNLSPAMEEFLKEDCKAGDYTKMLVMVNKQYMKEFMEYLHQFYARAGILHPENADRHAVLGQNKKAKLSLVKDTKKDDTI